MAKGNEMLPTGANPSARPRVVELLLRPFQLPTHVALAALGLLISLVTFALGLAVMFAPALVLWLLWRLLTG